MAMLNAATITDLPIHMHHYSALWCCACSKAVWHITHTAAHSANTTAPTHQLLSPNPCSPMASCGYQHATAVFALAALLQHLAMLHCRLQDLLRRLSWVPLLALLHIPTEDNYMNELQQASSSLACCCWLHLDFTGPAAAAAAGFVTGLLLLASSGSQWARLT
jgi:hypothetical protein